jgi:hypothetical protein
VFFEEIPRAACRVRDTQQRMRPSAVGARSCDTKRRVRKQRMNWLNQNRALSPRKYRNPHRIPADHECLLL